MKCAIMQPTYLPWIGYFHLMANADVFVFLDDAQFQKNSWHSRNRLLVNHQPYWITVPIRHTALEQSLKETLLCEEKCWRRKHANLLQQTYARHPFKLAIDEIVAFIQQDDAPNLAVLNIRLINFIAKKMEIDTPVRLSSEMSVGGRRTERILNILNSIQASEYISPKGAAGYLEADGFTSQTDIALKFQTFTPEPYPQHRHEPFIPYLSVVDAVANLGWAATAEYVQNSNLRAQDYEQTH